MTGEDAVKARDLLVSACEIPVAGWCLDSPEAFHGSRSQQARMILAAGIGYLIATDMITVADPDTLSPFLPMSIPAEMRPKGSR